MTREPSAWPGGIATITLLVDDLDDSKRFYRRHSGGLSPSKTRTPPCSGSATPSSIC